jgi:aryl-alcohol dehydrogenase-like predicted oxidoreductase
MDYRQLGRSGLRISRLTLGTMTFGGRGQFSKVGDTDLEGGRRQIDMALDPGVNIIDTADVYSAGASEEIIGEALGRKRDQRCWRPRLAFRWAPARTTRVSHAGI